MTDLFELLGPPSDAQVRRLIALMRLSPERQAQPAEQKPTPVAA